MDCYPAFDHPAGDFPGVLAQGAYCISGRFISVIGGSFPMALWGRTSL